MREPLEIKTREMLKDEHVKGLVFRLQMLHELEYDVAVIGTDVIVVDECNPRIDFKIE